MNLIPQLERGRQGLHKARCGAENSDLSVQEVLRGGHLSVVQARGAQQFGARQQVRAQTGGNARPLRAIRRRG